MGAGIVGVVASLLLVLGLLLLAVRAMRRFAPGFGTTDPTIPMRVLRRLSVGPRQGIALVQVGTRTLAVSVGDGGVRFLTEVAADAVVAPVAPSAPVGVAVEAPFSRSLRSALKGFGLGALLLMCVAAPLSAQATPRTAAPAAAGAVVGAVPATASRAAAVDSLLPRLAPQLDLRVGGQGTDGLRLSGTVGIVVMMGLLTLLPMLVLMMTGFTRILIVMHFLRQAIGAQSAPPAQLVAGLSLLLTMFVMAPTIDEVNRTAFTPWMDGQIEQAEMMRTAAQPLRAFMLRQTRESDIESFLELSGTGPVADEAAIPLVVLTSAFVTSELRIAFQIGFALFLPFLVIDIVVASVLMSVGMMMVPPAMISLPFKLLLFVLVDGWTLVIQSLIRSFH